MTFPPFCRNSCSFFILRSIVISCCVAFLLPLCPPVTYENNNQSDSSLSSAKSPHICIDHYAHRFWLPSYRTRSSCLLSLFLSLRIGAALIDRSLRNPGVLVLPNPLGVSATSCRVSILGGEGACFRGKQANDLISTGRAETGLLLF